MVESWQVENHCASYTNVKTGNRLYVAKCDKAKLLHFPQNKGYPTDNILTCLIHRDYLFCANLIAS